MESLVHILRRIAEQVGCLPIRQIAVQPGIQAVYRVTVYYPDMQASDTVATLVSSNINGILLETIYRERFDNKPLVRRLTNEEFEAFTRALRSLSFDTLADQPNIPSYGVDFCLVERGAGSYLKSILLAPPSTNGAYSKLVDIIKEYLKVEKYR